MLSVPQMQEICQKGSVPPSDQNFSRMHSFISILLTIMIENRTHLC